MYWSVEVADSTTVPMAYTYRITMGLVLYIPISYPVLKYHVADKSLKNVRQIRGMWGYSVYLGTTRMW